MPDAGVPRRSGKVPATEKDAAHRAPGSIARSSMRARALRKQRGLERAASHDSTRHASERRAWCRTWKVRMVFKTDDNPVMMHPGL